MNQYEELKLWRLNNIGSVINDHKKLNEFHDQLMIKTCQIALEKIESEWGAPPTHFAFFVMGSAGRCEQSVWSDQDHGIVYQAETSFQDYFLKLGAEISKGLAIIGYEECDGNVMAANPLWCKSLLNWEDQIEAWLEKGDWESLRFFSTFFDSRVIVGDKALLARIKDVAFKKFTKQPYLFRRMYENVGYIEKGIGFFGQLLPKEKGEDTGTINFKQTILFPYVNALRLLALVEKIFATSTLQRIEELPESYQVIKRYESDFIKLLDYRLYFQKEAQSYKKVHLLHVNSLSAREKENLKMFMKNGRELFKKTKQIIEKRCLQ
ncbi:DUF294 nucleotidyltransferase-like domain-containing protein [Bacillaceae bacterium IKA-2]|nr:DUF294 nucleotidyltransferase-like domain-containing protein [Bacillaceae bacterium IKA-2]